MTHPDIFNGKPTAEILAIYQRYRSGESVRLLLDELGCKEVSDSQFYRLFHNVRINNLCCPYCTNVPMLAKLPGKTSPIERIPHICQNCEHTVLSDFEGSVGVPAIGCKCKGCSEAYEKQKKIQEQPFVDKILAAYKVQQALSCHALDAVSLADLVGLHALVNTWADENMTHLRPLSKKLELLWPIESKSMSSVSEIYRMGLLQLDLAHCTTAAFVEKENGSIGWYADLAELIPSIKKADECCMDIPETMGYLVSLMPVNLSNEQKSELPALMLDIAIYECIQYFQNQLNEHGFDSVLGEKSEKMFEDLLEHLAVNQILPCIWSAVRGAAAFYLTPGCSGRKHAFNSIHAKLRDAAQRRFSGELELKGFERNKYNPRSEISFSLYGLLGFDSDVGFKTLVKDIPVPTEWEFEDIEEYENGFEYISYTTEEQAEMEAHGFEVNFQFDATRRLPYSEHEIQVFKTLEAASLYFGMSVRVGVDSEYFYARFTELDALFVYLGAFEKSNQLAEMLGE